MSRKLTLDDIADARAHERGRVDYRTTTIELKKRRRVGVGPIITFVFENRETMRFQIQEMARAEKILSDGAIQAELDVYNPLIPEPGTLSASMFIELTSEPELRSWLPKLVGVEGGPVIGLPGASDGARREVWAAVEAATRPSCRGTTSPPRCTTCGSSSRRRRSTPLPPGPSSWPSTTRTTDTRRGSDGPPSTNYAPIYGPDLGR